MLLIFLTKLEFISCFGTGAPVTEEICDSMTPGHGFPITNGTSPANVTVSDEIYQEGKPITGSHCLNY